MKIFDFFIKPKIKDNVSNTMEKQAQKVASKKTYIIKKLFDIKILISEIGKIDNFEVQITNYYEKGYKLIGSISMHGSILCATMIKER